MLNILEKISEKLTEWIGTPLSVLIHTILFIAIFSLEFFGLTFDQILLILTTAVSLEAIYLAIFIQMTVNKQSQSLSNVEEDIDNIEKDVDDIQKDVDDIQEDVDDLQEDVQEINEDTSVDDMVEDKLMADIEDIGQRLIELQKDIAELKKVRKATSGKGASGAGNGA